MPLGEFSSNPPLRFGHLDISDASTKKSTEVQTGENSSMGPRIGDADTELWRGERIRNSPSEIYRPRNLPDPIGLSGSSLSRPSAAGPGIPWKCAVAPLPGPFLGSWGIGPPGSSPLQGGPPRAKVRVRGR